MRRNHLKVQLFPLFILLFIGFSIQAQDAAYQKTKAFSDAARANAAKLAHYSWQMKVTPTIDGDAKPASVYQFVFDVNGKLQKTLMTAPEDPSGLGKRIKEKKMGEFKEWGGELADLVKQYMAPSEGTLLDFFSKATTAQDPSGMVLVSGANFIQPGDKVSYVIDPATGNPKKFSFTSTLDGDPVSGDITYSATSDGLKYPAQIILKAPAKKLTAVIENYNYIKQ